MELRQTHDVKEISTILHHPGLFPLIWDYADDDLTDVDDDVLTGFIEDNDCIFLLAKEINSLLALVVFHRNPMNDLSYKIHLNVLPDYWGKGIAKRVGHAAIDWIFTHTRCQRVIASVPNTRACLPLHKIATRVGMTKYAETLGTYRAENGLWYGENLYHIDKGQLQPIEDH